MASVTFSTNLSDPSVYPDCKTVGTVYEVAINGVGYMLADHPEREDVSYRRRTIPLELPRLVTADAAFNETIERYNFTAFTDYSGGAGQKLLERPESAASKFWESSGVNPFEHNELTLLNAVTTSISSAHTNLRSVVVGDVLYTLTAAGTLSSQSAPGGATTAISLGAFSASDLATDGQRWYACDPAVGINRGTSASASWTTAVKPDVISWAGQRICVAYRGSGSSTPNVFSTLNQTPAEEVAGGRLILDAGWTITKPTGGPGRVWFGAYAGDLGKVYGWNLSADAPSVAIELPQGQIPRSCFYYLNNLFVRASRKTSAGGVQALIYRFPVDGDANVGDGELIVKIGEDDTASDFGEGTFGAASKFVFFSWRQMGTFSGVGAIDLSSGGYARWFEANAGTGTVVGITPWRERLVFSVNGTGVMVQNPSAFVASGWVKTSISDKASALDKVFDSITLVADPLGVNESVSTDFTLDDGATYSAFADGSLSSAGEHRKTADFRRKAASIGLKLTLSGPGTSTPRLTLVQIRLHPHGLADTVLQLPVNCADRVSGLNGKELPENGRGKGAARARTLEALAQTRIKFQDLDWPATRTAEIYEVYSVDVHSVQVDDRAQGRNAIRQVAVLQLRKAVR